MARIWLEISTAHGSVGGARLVSNADVPEVAAEQLADGFRAEMIDVLSFVNADDVTVRTWVE